MTKAEEKAKELVDRFLPYIVNADRSSTPNTKSLNIFLAQKCALVAVEEILKSEPTNPFDGLYYETYSDLLDEVAGFWKDVKKALEHNG